MNLTVQATGCSFVKEVRDIALWADGDQTTVDLLEEIWRTCGVLIFRRQALSEDELIAFASRFGALETVVRQDWRSEKRPEVIRISNMRNEAGERIGLK